MSLSNQIRADVGGVFLRGAGDFEVQVGIKTQEAPGVTRNIYIVIEDEIDAIFEEGSDTIDVDRHTIQLSGVDDVVGRITPKEMGRGGAGDKFVNLPGSSDTWYLIRILDNGVRNGSYVHRVLIANKPLGLMS